jgi:hypothetical protein
VKIAESKLAESAKELRAKVAAQDAQHTSAHKLDRHSLAHKGGTPAPVVGGDHPQRHHTLYQGKMKRNETATVAGIPRPRTIFQRQQAAAGYPLSDKE